MTNTLSTMLHPISRPTKQAKPEIQTLRQPERLTEQLDVELDFARISHQTDSAPLDTTSQTHPHILFAPVHYEPEYAYPLLVWLHGPGGDERQVMRIMPTVSMRNYVAVGPRGLAAASADPVEPNNKFDVSSILHSDIRSKEFYDWSENDLADAEQRVFDCITVAKERCNIATDRIFLAGFGNGGTMALRLALLYPRYFAGVASLGGAFPKNGRLSHCWDAVQPFSVFLAVGEKSTECSPEAACQTLELFSTAGIAVNIREYPCGQELAPPMLQDLNRWMMKLICD